MKKVMETILVKLGLIQIRSGSRDHEEIKQFRYISFMLLSWISLSLALVWLVVSAYLDIVACKHYWLAPSGSILVLSAVSVEFFTSITYKHGHPDIANFYVTSKFTYLHEFFRKIGFLFIVAGTIVWGYAHMWIG